jgi:hypothetical protein
MRKSRRSKTRGAGAAPSPARRSTSRWNPARKPAAPARARMRSPPRESRASSMPSTIRIRRTEAGPNASSRGAVSFASASRATGRCRRPAPGSSPISASVSSRGFRTSSSRSLSRSTAKSATTPAGRTGFRVPPRAGAQAACVNASTPF